MSTEMVYDPSIQKWVPTTSNSSGSVVNSSTPSPSSTSSPQGSSVSSPTTPQPSSGSKTQVNSTGKANKEQAVLEYNTLEGDLTLRACVGVLKVREGTTIDLEGVGSYLSGQYYVSSVTYSLDASSGFSMTCTLVKTGFGGSSLKSSNGGQSQVQDSSQGSISSETGIREEAIDKKDSSTYADGDNVKIVGDDAVYSNASSGVKVPNWVKQKTLTVQKISDDGTRVLLQPINSWTYTKYVQKV